MIRPEAMIAEGFRPVVIADVGWPWTPDKFMCECGFCRNGPGIFYKIDTPQLHGEILIPVHSYCFEEAKRYFDGLALNAY